ncbi:MAG: type II toxin-antitoxin system RelE/ParE family toxin [Salinisphaera sp.]|nr:type II toxin-antitoxin system RelE/ParE family toxin [Salinisphaera sp.]
MREIVFYRTESGRCPVEEFLDSLGSKQAQKVAWVLRLVEELDLVPGQYFKKLVGSEEIWEVRVQVAGNIFRVLGFLDGTELVVLNHAFQKKTQKIPPKEIRTAEKRKRDYLARKDL